MKKFTKLWQVMMIVLLSSSIAFAQTTVQDVQKGNTAKDYLLKQKVLSTVKVNTDGFNVQNPDKGITLMSPESIKVQQIKSAKKAQVIVDADPKAGGPVPPAEYLFDYQFEWPLTNPNGLSVGIETDGNFIYTCHWQYDTLYRYDMSGNYVGYFFIGGVNLMRDIAYNPVTGYFYGAAAGTTVWVMDFTPGAELLVGTITAPTAIRAIGCDHDNQFLFGNNWSTNVSVFDLSGVEQYNFAVGPVGASYYGFAYDNYSSGGPYIWGYSQNPTSREWLIQMDINGVETGTVFDVGTFLGHDPVNDLAGGLAITPPGTFGDPPVPAGEWSIFGISQNAYMWAIELDDPNPCGTPVALTVTNIGDNSADLGWTETGTSTMWDIEIQLAGVAFTGVPTHPGITSPYPPYPMTGLASLTSYDWQVRADCGGGTSSGWSVPSTFTTTGGDCMWEIVGYDDYGDTWNGGFIDIYVDGGLVGTWTGPAGAGPDSYFFPVLDPSIVDIVWTEGGWPYECSYYVYDNSGVEVANDGVGGVDPTGITGIGAYCSSCPAPSNLSTDTYTATTATAHWDDANFANNYDIVWGLYGFDPDAGPFVGTAYNVTYMGSPYSYILTGLTIPGPTYEFYVRADCGIEESPWVRSAAFPPPANDECVNAEYVAGPYPTTVLGTTLGATI
ncbi:MAG: hypothetical protein K8R68_09370, partial [Bacteroidales bacterium]|nr:hypothetical protein [Bacteroidales bacterium]